MAAKIEHIEVKGIQIPLIFEEERRLPLVNTQIVFTNSGSITDVKKAGLAKFSAKMLNEGSLEMGANGFAEMLESKAIHISASTGSETFVIEMGSLNEQFKTSAKYLKMLLKSPNFTERSLEKVKTMTMGSISRKENDYDYVASNALKGLLFKGTVLAQPAAGTLKSVKSIRVDDVKSFVKKHLVLSRAIVVVGGDVDIEAVKKHPEIETWAYHNLKRGKDFVKEDGSIIPNQELTLPPPPAKSYAYCSDTVYKPDIVPLIKNVDLLYHEATFLEQHKDLAAKTKHSTARQAAQIAKDAGVKKLVLGHFSSRYPDETLFAKEAAEIFKNVDIAQEGKSFEI